MCAELESRVAAPWTSEALTGPTPRQLLSLMDVIVRSTDAALDGGTVTGPTSATALSDPPSYGRQVRMAGEGGSYCVTLSVNLRAWALEGGTPLWMGVRPGSTDLTVPQISTALTAAGLQAIATVVAQAQWFCRRSRSPVTVALRRWSRRRPSDSPTSARRYRALRRRISSAATDPNPKCQGPVPGASE